MRSRGGVATAGLPFDAIRGGAVRVPRVARMVTMMLMARRVVSAVVVVPHDLRRLEVLRYCRVHEHHGHQRRQPACARSSRQHVALLRWLYSTPLSPARLRAQQLASTGRTSASPGVP